MPRKNILKLVVFALLAGVRVDVRAEGPREAIPELIERLGHSSFEVREASQRELIRRGPEAVQPLAQAARSGDPEVAHRAQLILSRVDPLLIRLRIQKISLDDPARIVESLTGQASEEESGELLLPERFDPGDRSSGYAVQYRLLPGGEIDLSVEEALASYRSPLSSPSPRRGAVSILKRGDEALYRQSGSHLERERHPFVTLLSWWTERRSTAGPSDAGAGKKDDELGELVQILLRQAESQDLKVRRTALEILGLLGAPSAEGALRAALNDQRTRAAGLVGLARLSLASPGRLSAELVQSLEEVLAAAQAGGADPAGDTVPAAPPPQKALAPGASGPVPAPGRALSDSGLLLSSFWPIRAALVLVQAGEPAGFDYLAQRVAEVDPSEIHPVIATLADHLERAPEATQDRLLSSLASPELLIHLPWDDPEVEHFYGKILERLPPGAALSQELLLNLARLLSGETGMGPVRSRVLAHLWARATRGAPAPALARSMVKEVLDAARTSLRLSEIVAWVGLAFRDEPMPPEEFGRLLVLLRRNLGRPENGLQYLAASALVDLARGPALSEDELVELARLLAEAGTMPNQPYSQEILGELERLTGVAINRTRRNTRVTRAPVVPTTAPSLTPPAAGKTPSSEDEGPIEQAARWAADPAQVAASLKRLREPSAEGGEGLEYWEFDLLVPNRPSRAGRAQPAAPDEGTRPIEVLDGRRKTVASGAGFQSIDRWGNRLSLRLDPERSGTPPRYRLNGQSSLELDLPAYASLRELELRIGWYETCDSRLGANPLARPVGRLQKVVCLRSLGRAGSAGPGAGPPAEAEAVEPARLWEEFLEGFLLDLGRRDATWRSKAFPFVREFGLRQALPFLGEEFRRSARADVAQILVELGGAEVLRAELAGADTLHRVQAAQALTNACDSAGFREFLTLLRARPKDLNLYGALMCLDTFLAACEPGAEERKEALELIVSSLHEQLFQARGFSILGRESGTDFGYSNATRLPVAQGRKEAVARAVEAARSWWNARRASGASPR